MCHRLLIGAVAAAVAAVATATDAQATDARAPTAVRAGAVQWSSSAVAKLDGTAIERDVDLVKAVALSAPAGARRVTLLTDQLATTDIIAATGAFASDPVADAWVPYWAALLNQHADNTALFPAVRSSDDEAVVADAAGAVAYVICAQHGGAEIIDNASSSSSNNSEQGCGSVEDVQALAAGEGATIRLKGFTISSEATATHFDHTIRAVMEKLVPTAADFVAVCVGVETPDKRTGAGIGKCVGGAQAMGGDRKLQGDAGDPVPIVLLVQSHPMTISGLIVTLVIVLLMGVYFSCLHDITGPLTFATRYPYSGKEYD